MRKGGGKNKGSSFEREICVKLSLWMSKGKQEDIFWRSAMSGGRSTVSFNKGKRLAAQAGDISCVHPSGAPLIEKFMIECKAYRDLNYVGLLTRRGRLVEFWLEARRNANRYSKMPLLIAKQNQQPTVVCLPAKGLALLGVEPLITAHHLRMHMVLLENFLETAKPP
jgi:hypothetical protein